MKLTAKLVVNLKTKEVRDKVEKARDKALKDTITDITNDAVKGSPHRTGHNRRSIKPEIGPGGEIAKKKGEGAVYSTSGYGGYLETGTVNMPAQPYFKPAYDKNIHKLTDGLKKELA